MHVIWVLVAMPMASLLYTAWVIARGERVSHSNVVVLVASLNIPSNALRGPFRQVKREVTWISTRDIDSIVHRSENVIVVDLFPKGSERPDPFRGADLLFVAPNDFFDVLRSAPASSSVMLYGPSDLCKTMTGAVKDIAGFAPVYVLTAELV